MDIYYVEGIHRQAILTKQWSSQFCLKRKVQTKLNKQRGQKGERCLLKLKNQLTGISWQSRARVFVDLCCLLPPAGSELWGGLEASDYSHGHERHLRLLQRQGLPSSFTFPFNGPRSDPSPASSPPSPGSLLCGQLHPLHDRLVGNAHERGNEAARGETHVFPWNVPDCGHCSVLSMLQVPRMIVNVVQILPMQTLREVQKPTPGCLLQRWAAERLSLTAL